MLPVPAAPSNGQGFSASMSPNDDRLSNRARLGLRLARTNIAGKNYHAASVTLQTFADEGVAQAESMLGLLYARGKGVERDFQKSQALFKSAAAKGDPDGLYYMGYSYLEGSGVEADPVTALAYYIQAAARGHEQAAVERDKGYAALDDTERVRADSRSRDLGLPMPAGWLHDSESGVAFWSPSWYRNGSYKVKVNARSVEGYAHGAGKVGLTASLPGSTSRVLDGVFSNGVLFDGEPIGLPFELLETDDFLVDLSGRLPADFPGGTLWLRKKLDGARVTLCPLGSPDLLVVVNEYFPALDDDAIADIGRTALSIVMDLCPLDDNAHATVTTIPVDHQRVFDDGELKFEPRQAEITLYNFGGDPSTWDVTVRNLSAAVEAERVRLEEERREEAERKARRLREERAAAMRGTLDVRGVRLGMTLAAVHALFEDEIESWEPKWDADREMPAFSGFKQNFQLRDKAAFEASFTSAQNDSQLFAVGYSQTSRHGPTPETLRADLEAKYGAPSEVHSRGMRLTWFLPSKRGGPTSAALKARFKIDRETGLVGYLGLGISDWDLGHYDESVAYDARLKAERQAALRKEEENKSDEIKF